MVRVVSDADVALLSEVLRGGAFLVVMIYLSAAARVLLATLPVDFHKGA